MTYIKEPIQTDPLNLLKVIGIILGIILVLVGIIYLTYSLSYRTKKNKGIYSKKSKNESTSV